MNTRRILQAASLVVAFGALVVWLATGASRKVWNASTVEVRTLDEVTGIEQITNVKKFQPGLVFLFGAWAGGAVLACSALLFRNKPKTNSAPAEPSNS